MATLTYVTGTSAASGYVRVGHNSSATNPDAVWSFVPTQTGASKITGVKFVLTWDNSTAGTGWSGTYNYVFAVSSSGASGTTAYDGSVLGRTTVSLSGASGTATATVTGLSLTPGTTYYLRANFAGTTKSTMKAFKTTGGTATVANYTSLTYTISYNANGGSGTTPSSQTKTYGTALTLRSTSGLTRTGYHCIGWSTSATATTATYASGGSYTTEASATLYAVWTENTLAIKYYANGGEQVGDPAETYPMPWTSSGAKYNAYFNGDNGLANISTFGLQRAGYSATSKAEWTGSNGETFDHNEKISVIDLATRLGILSSLQSNATTTGEVSANWKKETYTISFNANGGTIPSGQPTSIVGEYGSTITTPVPTRTGYAFKGWAINFNGTSYVNYGRTFFSTTGLNVHFSAYMDDWANFRTPYRLLSCAEAGGWIIEPSTKNNGFVVSVYGENESKYLTAYSLMALEDVESGWHTFDIVWGGAGSSFSFYIDDELQDTSDKISGKIKYNATNALFMGAESASSQITPSASYNYFVGKIGDFHISTYTTKYGYGSYNKFNVPAQNVSLEAIWEPLPVVTITFDANGGTVSPTEKQCYYGSTYGEFPTPQKAGYMFIGWYTSEGASIVSGSSVLYPYNHTLYAHWAEHGFTVKFDTNGGSGSTQAYTKNCQYGFETEITFPNGGYGGIDSQKFGYAFESVWHENSPDGRAIGFGEKIKSTALESLASENNDEIVYYLKWYDGGKAHIINNGSFSFYRPYVFINGEWREAMCYIYDGEKWKTTIEKKD